MSFHDDDMPPFPDDGTAYRPLENTAPIDRSTPFPPQPRARERRMPLRLKVTLVLLACIIAVVPVIFIANASSGWFAGHTGRTSTTGSGPAGLPTTGASTAGATIAGCGVAKTASGYTFSWLHAANGYIVDANNCAVDLRGFNWAAVEFGAGVGGSKQARISPEHLAWFSHTFHMNVFRIGLNAVWWNTNVYVPDAGMNYRDWVRQIVTWVEQAGDYVLLTKGPQFPAPPCGGSVTYCPPQDQGALDVAAHPGDPTVLQEITTGQYIDQGIQMWNSLAALYANDPAVLYDSWNEMHRISAQTWQQSENALITAIRARNPRSLIFLGGPNWQNNINPLVRGVVPNFTQANLVYDFHVYDGFQGTMSGKNCQEPNSYLWQDWPSHANEQVAWAQQHGDAVSISEWGGCNDLDQYNQALAGFAQAHHIALAYYETTNVFTVVNGQYQLTDNGVKVQRDYASM